MKQNVMLSITQEKNGFKWFVSKELTGNDEDSWCDGFETWEECFEDMKIFMNDSDVFGN